MFTYFVTCEIGQICLGLDIVMAVLRKASSSFKYAVSYLFGLKANVKNKYDMFYIMLVQ